MHGLQVQDAEIGYVELSVLEPFIWRALIVQSSVVRSSCFWLRLHGFKPYWPRYRVEPTREIRNRRHVRWSSVIAGYLFLPIPIWQVVSSDFFEYAPGIRDFMRNTSGNIVEIKRFEIDMIRKIEAAMQASAIAAVQRIPFKVGQKIRLVNYGVEGKILEIEGKRRIVVETSLLNGAPITLPVSEIEAI